jgi:hypothetical protein
MISTSSKTNLFCAALVASFVVGCGKAKKETVYVKEEPTNPQGNGNNPDTGLPTDPARAVDMLGVVIKNNDQIDKQTVTQGQEVEFGLAHSASQISGIQYKCSVEKVGASGTQIGEPCSSPYRLQAQEPGQYTFSVFAVHGGSNVSGKTTQAKFSVAGAGQIGGGGFGQGGGGFGQGGGVVINGGGGSVQFKQIGDLLRVTVPVGMHTVLYSSTFDQPGYLKFTAVDGSMNDAASPFPIYCAQQGQNFQRLVFDVSPAGRPITYCEITPPLAMNSPGDPMYNAFRWMTMNTMSYNSIAIASDASLGANGAIQHSGPALSKLFVNVFTNMSGQPVTQSQSAFTNEFSQTVSRLQISCGSQSIQFLGNAPTIQGYFGYTVGVSPLFGCVNARGGKYYVNVGTFPMDQITPLAPACGWNCWSNQRFTNLRAAEIVAEIGPFDYPPSPMGLAADAQNMMIQNIRKL